jgi:hypothetical protein
MPKNDCNYGNTKDYSSKIPDCRFYYLLNVWHQDTEDLLGSYYSPEKLDTETGPERHENIDQNQDLENKILQLEKMSPDSLTRLLQGPDFMKNYLNLNTLTRTLEFAFVESRQRPSPKTEVNEDNVKNIIQFGDHVIHFRCTLIDLIIRCCSAPVITTKDITNLPVIIPKFMLISMFQYRDLLYLLVTNTKFGQQVLEVFKLNLTL